jgi:hypothetical protein
MKEKSIEIIAPEGYEVDKERSSFEKIVFRALPDKGLPKTWEGFGLIEGYYVESGRYAQSYFGTSANPANRKVFPTREEAEASIALAQLCQLRDRYNGQTGVEGCDHRASTPYVGGDDEDVIYNNLLSFKTRELRDEFANNFSDLIEKAKPLLG